MVRKEPKKGSQRLYRIKRINTEWEVGNVRIDTMVIKIIVIKNDSGRGELDTRKLQNDLGKEERDLKK